LCDFNPAYCIGIVQQFWRDEQKLFDLQEIQKDFFVATVLWRINLKDNTSDDEEGRLSYQQSFV